MEVSVVSSDPAQTGKRAKRTFLPEFADARNRALDKDISALEAELERAQAQLEENEDHTRVLSEHLDNVRQEITHTQARVAARRREVDSEAHLKQIAARETGRLRGDIARLQRQRDQLEQRATAMRTAAFQAGERMDQFKLLQNWNQEELEQWLAAARQKEEDSLALERYRRQDEARVKELGMALERVSREAYQGERDLDEECVETVAAQAELAKVAQDFRRLHGERQELLAQWEGVLEAIARRDAAILEAGQEQAERAAQLAVLQQELTEQAAELDAELAEGEAAQRLILQQERQIKGLCELYRSSQTAAAEAEDKADQLANDLGQAADQAQRQAAASGHLQAELERRAAAVEAAQARVDSARVRLQLEGQQLGSMQQKIQQLEALQAEEQQRAASLDKQVAALAKQQFQAAQELHDGQERQRQLAAEARGARTQGRNLSHRIAQLEEQLSRQQEVRYTADYELLQMEQRVTRAEGRRTKDETQQLEACIRQLESTLAAVLAEHSMLAQEVKRAEEDYARAQRQSQAVQAEQGAIVDDMARLTVEGTAVGRALKQAGKEREERLLCVDMCRLELRRLRTLLNSKSGEVVSLEVRKRSLEAGMIERRSEIEVQLELMQGEERLLRDELHRVALELQSRKLTLQKLQRKHDTLRLKGRSQDGGEVQSQAYYIIRAAQERQELAEQAGVLQAKIEQEERAVSALEATLRRLQGTNSDMHFNARHTGPKEVVEQHAALRRQLEAAEATLRSKLAEENSLDTQLEQARARLANVAAEEAGLRQRVEAVQRQKAEAEQQLQEQLERRQRATQRASKLQRQALLGGSSVAGDQDPATQSLPPALLVADVQLAQVKAATKGMVEALVVVARQHPELQLLHRIEAEAGVRLAAAASGSRPGSAASAGTSAACGNSTACSSAGGCHASSRPSSAAQCEPGLSGGRQRSRPASSCSSGRLARGSLAKQPSVQTVQLQL